MTRSEAACMRCIFRRWTRCSFLPIPTAMTAHCSASPSRKNGIWPPQECSANPGVASLAPLGTPVPGPTAGPPAARQWGVEHRGGSTLGRTGVRPPLPPLPTHPATGVQTTIARQLRASHHAHITYATSACVLRPPAAPCCRALISAADARRPLTAQTSLYSVLASSTNGADDDLNGGTSSLQLVCSLYAAPQGPHPPPAPAQQQPHEQQPQAAADKPKKSRKVRHSGSAGVDAYGAGNSRYRRCGRQARRRMPCLSTNHHHHHHQPTSGPYTMGLAAW